MIRLGHRDPRLPSELGCCGLSGRGGRGMGRCRSPGDSPLAGLPRPFRPPIVPGTSHPAYPNGVPQQ